MMVEKQNYKNFEKKNKTILVLIGEKMNVREMNFAILLLIMVIDLIQNTIFDDDDDWKVRKTFIAVCVSVCLVRSVSVQRKW